VTSVDLTSVEADTLSREPDSPVDLLIVADGHTAPRAHATNIVRGDFVASLGRLTFTPFRLANLVRPYLSPAARLVLLTRSDARMTVPDTNGAYLDRPFRAAAHALWRCMSVEWRKDGIVCALVAIDHPADSDRLIDLLPVLPIDSAGCQLRDVNGSVLDW
jgi:NAD(P)-dependent dehydrogenase (short-subunit alcohol dehydrogenase family)